MLNALSEEERKKLLPWTYFVGAGYFPSFESFNLGMEVSQEHCTKNIFSADTLEREVARLKKPSRWVLVFFLVTCEPGKVKENKHVTKEDAIWFLNNQARY